MENNSYKVVELRSSKEELKIISLDKSDSESPLGRDMSKHLMKKEEIGAMN